MKQGARYFLFALAILGTPISDASAEGTSGVAALLGKGEYNRARAEAQELVEEEPQNASALALLGQAEYALGNLSQAVESLEASLALKPGNKEALRTLAYARHQRGDWPEAQQAYEDWSKASPGEAEPLIGLGAALSARKQQEEAGQAFRRAVKADPKSFRARMYAEISSIQETPVPSRAKQDLRTARKESREQGKKDYSQGLQLREVGDMAGAMKKWEEALARNPDDKETRKAYDKLVKSLRAKADAYVLAGQNLEEAEAYADAKAAYEKALANDPDHAAAAKHLLDLESSRRKSAEKHARKAQALLLKGRLQEAATEYQEALAFQDDPASRAALRTALKDIRTENIRLLYLAGQAAERDAVPEARKLLEEALALEPALRPRDTTPSKTASAASSSRSARAKQQEMYLEGLSSYVSGDLESALQVWRKILKENPKHGSAREGVSKAQNELDVLKAKSLKKPK